MGQVMELRRDRRRDAGIERAPEARVEPRLELMSCPRCGATVWMITRDRLVRCADCDEICACCFIVQGERDD